MLKYETLNDHIEDLCSWFNIDKKYADKYQRKTRNINYKKLNNKRLEKMKKLYGRFFDFTDNLPNVITNP